MAIGTFNSSMTAGKYTFLDILSGANNATDGLFMTVLILCLYFLVFVVFKERIPDVRNAALSTGTIMLFLCLFLFWSGFINQYIITISIVIFVLTLIMAIWRGDQ
jgi:hypothetical protein